MNKKVIVIHEKDLDDKEEFVVGVASSVIEAERMIEEYYGDSKLITTNYIDESNIIYIKVLEVMGMETYTYKVQVSLEWFQIDCV